MPTPINFGLVGLHFGKTIANRYFKPGQAATPYFRLAAVCSQERDITESVAAESGAKAVHDLDVLLADPDIPVIGLYTGPNGRANLIRKIIRAGKDVMTTKPFEIDPDAAMDVLLEARRLGRVVHMNSPGPLLSPDLAQMKAWQTELNLGRAIGCRSDIWCIYREKPDGSWYDDPIKCPAAPIFRLGIYLINDLVRLFGPASRVMCVSSRVWTGRPTADNAQLTVEFQNGAIASIFGSFCVMDGQSYKNALTLNFERGTIYRNVGPVPPDYKDGRSNLKAVFRVSAEDPTRNYRETLSEGKSGGYQWDVLYRAVHGEKIDGLVTPEEIVEGVRIVAAMGRAERSGCVEKV